MFCPECGRRNDDSAVFCEECGTRLKNPEPNDSGIMNEKKVKRGFPVDRIMIIEIGAVLLSFAIFAGIYNTRFSAESIAERYVKAVYGCNWDKVYDMLLIEESGDFMTKEAFITASAINYDTVEPAEADIIDVEKRSGGLFTAKYSVNCDLPDEPGTMDVKLRRKGLSWKVDTQDYMVEDYTVLIPSGAKLKIDKVDIPEEMKGAERKKGFDTYEIPKVFGFTHYVEIEGENLESAGQLITRYEDEDGGGSIVRTGYDGKTVESVMKQAEADLENILNAAAFNKRFSEVAVFEKMSESNKEDVISTYDFLRNSCFGNESDGNILLKYELTNGEIKGKVEDEREEGLSLIRVELKGQYYMERQYYLEWLDEVSTTDEDGNCSYVLRYVNEDDTWKLYNMEIDGFY